MDEAARARDRFRVETLPGLPVADARARVEGLGGDFEVIGDFVVADINFSRVRVTVAGGQVVSAEVG